MPPNTTPYTFVPPPPTSPSPAPRKKWPLVAAAVAGIFVLGAGVAFTLLFLNKPPQSPSSTPVTGTASTTASSSTTQATTTQYLAFQVFLNDSTVPNAAELGSPPNKAALAAFVQGAIDKIGSTGTVDRKLGFIFGPLAFDQTDAEIARVVSDAFDIAIEKNVAIGFHIDDSKFWQRRSDLWKNSANVEWLDWSGTPSMGLYLGWGNPPAKKAPPMCFNSKQNISAVEHEGADVIGAAIKKGIDRLVAAGKPELFAGVIMGWETAIGSDYDNNTILLGYCALTNLGYSKTNPPKDRDTALEGVVHDFIELWAKNLSDAGIPKDKIFAHVAYVDPTDPTFTAFFKTQTETYSELRGFAPLKVTFNNPYLSPGFSDYGTDMTDIYNQFTSAGITRWAVSEGTTDNAKMTMETYLARIFNHGGILVNLFSWGIGPVDPSNHITYETEGPTAITAYKKFLRGDVLSEQ